MNIDNQLERKKLNDLSFILRRILQGAHDISCPFFLFRAA